MVKEDSYILSWKKPSRLQTIHDAYNLFQQMTKVFQSYVDCPFIVDAVSCEAVRGMGLKVHRYSSNNLIC